MTESSDTPRASSSTSEADADHQGGSAGPDDQQLAGVSDDQLPEDLQPGEDNPLAEPLDPDDERTKDADELGMDATQDDTSGTYESSGETPSTQDKAGSDSDEETGGGANSGEGAQGSGVAEG
jgi:hypothetical protein